MVGLTYQLHFFSSFLHLSLSLLSTLADTLGEMGQGKRLAPVGGEMARGGHTGRPLHYLFMPDFADISFVSSSPNPQVNKSSKLMLSQMSPSSRSSRTMTTSPLPPLPRLCSAGGEGSGGDEPDAQLLLLFPLCLGSDPC